MTVGRFAPSPSGRMHLGNVFTALLAWLSVRSRNGKMLLRIEDLDPQRSKPEYIAALREDLLWLGLDWDEEMPLQSQRGEVYAEALSRLRDAIYPCYCTRNMLHEASAPHASDGKQIYAGTCKQLSAAERAEKTRTPAWRIAVPDRVIGFQDGVFGAYAEHLPTQCGDFILRRSDGVYAYQLAVVVDDAAGGVTEVVRGCDLLDSTPRQIWLHEMLGKAAPEFYHVPLLVAPDGRRLSKREKDFDLSYLRTVARPEEIVGLLAHAAGLLPAYEAVSAFELVRHFDWSMLCKKNIPINFQEICRKFH